MRGLVLSAGSAEYVQTSRLLGASARQTLLRDVLPNVIGPVVVYATLDFGNAILLLAGLSFLGLGAQPPTAEWGAMVSYGTQYFQDWWMSTFPGPGDLHRRCSRSTSSATACATRSTRDGSWTTRGGRRVSLLEVEDLRVRPARRRAAR